MSKQTSTGKCGLCGKNFGKAAMTRHLKTCDLDGAKAPAVSKTEQPAGSAFHLLVEARHSAAYWMHLAVPAESQLAKLDNFLRGAWLECCGHLSSFTIGGEHYSSSPMDSDESGMEIRLGRVLQTGTVFFHEYDFGSTTELKLKVLGPWEGGTKKGVIKALARNDAPYVACNNCGTQQAAQICTECACDDKGWLCDACAADHECGEDMFLPVVNSPRAGVCGYTG